MSFYNISFPTSIAKNVVGGPKITTNVVSTTANVEFVQKISKQPRIQYSIDSGVMSYDEISELVAFFRLCNGKTHSFRFKDWTDFKAKQEIPQLIDGETNKFHFIKTYNINEIEIKRKMSLPIINTVEIFVNNQKLDSEKYNISDDGVLSIFEQNVNQNDVRITFEFDVKMRFDCDALEITPNPNQSYTVKNLSLIEVL